MEANVFAVKKRQSSELQDGYDRGAALYYVVQVVLIVYGLGWIASLPLIQNAYVEHTYFKANNNGVLYSDRYRSMYWLSLVLSCVRPLVFLCMCFLLLFRSTTCCRQKYSGCTGFWISLLLVFVLLDLVSFAILGSFYSTCNGPGQLGNPCNALDWCCVPNIFNVPGNLCANTGPCNPLRTFEDLKVSVDFLWLFFVSFGFILADLFFLLLPIGLWIVNTATATTATDQEKAKDEADPLANGDEQLLDEGAEMTPSAPPASALLKKKIQSAVSRKMTKQT
jgi:hypothetical protein